MRPASALEVARALAGVDFAGCLLAEFAALVIDGVDLDFVEPEIGREGVFIIGRDPDRVCVRLLLSAGVDRGTLVLDEIAGLAKRAVFVDRQYRDAAAAVVGDEDVATGRVDADMAGAGADGRLSVDMGERAALLVDGEGGDGAAGHAVDFAGFADGVEITAVG